MADIEREDLPERMERCPHCGAVDRSCDYGCPVDGAEVVEYVRADAYWGAVEALERLRGINSELVQSYNSLLVALTRSESDAEALRDHRMPNVERIEQAIRRTRMARVAAGASRDTAAADRAYAVAAEHALSEQHAGVEAISKVAHALLAYDHAPEADRPTYRAELMEQVRTLVANYSRGR